jgi:hypothetical protein
MTGLLSPADILGIANETDPTRGAADVGYNGNTVKYFLDEIANGTAPPVVGPLSGMETVPSSLGMGLRQVTTGNIAQLALNLKNSEETVPITTISTVLTPTQYNSGIINFTGTLMGNSTVQLPYTSGIWVFANNTSGAYSLTLQTGVAGAVYTVETSMVYLNNWDGNQLLYKTPRTNMLFESQALSTAPWMLTGSTTITGGFTAPDGTATAWMVTDNDTTNPSYISNSSFNGVAGTTYTASIYVKEGTSTTGTFECYDTGDTITSSQITWTAGVPTVSMGQVYPLMNGWYRIALQVTPLVSGAFNFVYYPCMSTNPALTGSTYLWGGQVETGMAATSYIETFATAVTITDYMITTGGLVTLALPPTTGNTLTWTGTYLDAEGRLGTVTAMLFGTGNGVLTMFQLTPISGGGMTAVAPQGKSIIAYSDGTNVILASSAGANTLTKYDFIATTQGQTQIDVSYTPGNIIVTRMGLELPATDYVATTGAYITFPFGLNLNDEISVIAFSAFSAIGAISIYEFIATAGQTTFNVGYTPGAVQVFENGTLLLSTDYTASNGTSVMLNVPAMLGAEIKIISQQSSTVANMVPITGGTFTGPVMGPVATSSNQLVPLAQAQALGYTRQTVQMGVTNSLGYASMLTPGTGMTVNLSATMQPMVISFAAGATNYGATISADMPNIVTLPMSNTSFISADYTSPTSVTWTSTLAPVQYGYSYNQSAQSVLQFNGTSGSTMILDDFGNMWTAMGGATIQNTQYKFGTGALGGTGTNFALNGTSNYILSSGFKSLGNGSWSLRCWIWPTNAATTTVQDIFDASSSTTTNYGAQIVVYESKIQYYLSSTGTTWDIVNGTPGTNTINSGMWQFTELVYDSVDGKYYGYVNGLLDFTFASTIKVCPVSYIAVGAGANNTQWFAGYIDKFEFLPYCQHPNGMTYAVPTVAPNIATVGYSSDFFSVPNMTMTQVSGPSTTALANPMFTQKNRVYVGEAMTSTTLVTSAISYALKGQYDSGLFMVATNTMYNKNHNLGYTAFATEVRIADDAVGTNERYAIDYWYALTGWQAGITTRNSAAIWTDADYVGLTVAGTGTVITTGYYRVLTRRRW